jgi:hypothetical protein
VHTCYASVRGRRSTALAEKPHAKAGRRSRREGKNALLKDVPRMSDIKSKSHGGSSAKKEAARILSAAPRAISPCMRRSFVDR